jgi:hypothetical protein
MIPEIETWIFTATYGLAQQEIQRIKADVQEHFADACLEYQEKGLTISEAEARALADLGDAVIANQKYQAVYFTQDDEYRLQKLKMKSWWSELMLVSNLLLFGYAAYIIIIQPSSQNVSVTFRDGLSTLISATWLLALVFEVRLKKFMSAKAPNHQVFWMQALAVFLAHPFWFGLPQSLKVFLTPMNTWLPFEVAIAVSVFAVSIFCSLWLKMQLPLTIKAIRRLRA